MRFWVFPALRTIDGRHILCDTMTAPRELVRRALRVATPSMEDLAARLRLSTSALRRYRLGSRTPGSTVLRRLAAVLRERAAVMVRIARELEASAKEEADG